MKKQKKFMFFRVKLAEIKKHPNSSIEKAVKYAESKNWVYVEVGGSAHAWGKLICPNNNRDCRCGLFCQNSIWSTPKSPENHAKQIKRWVDGCIYIEKGNTHE